MSADDDQTVTWCPSGEPCAPESVVLGVRSGESGRVSYLASSVPAADVLPTIPDDIEPSRVLRFASHCVSNCRHRVGNDCSLVNRVRALPAWSGSKAVPRCHLRLHCQWWVQVGVDACHGCPAVARAIRTDDELGMLVADPKTTQDELDTWIAQAAQEVGVRS